MKTGSKDRKNIIIMFNIILIIFLASGVIGYLYLDLAGSIFNDVNAKEYPITKPVSGLKEAGASMDEAQIIILLIIITGLIFGIIFNLMITRTLKKPEHENLNTNLGLGTEYKKSKKSGDETVILVNSMKTVVEKIKEINNESNQLITSVRRGNLDIRGNSDNFTGCWKNMIDDTNQLIDAFIAPINNTSEYINRISKGDIPPKITEEYQGDFNEIKNNLNTCIESLNLLLSDMDVMSKEHDKGDIDVTIDTGKFKGAYKDMAIGVNNMVVGHINLYKKAISCFMEFGDGNLDAKIEKFPGKKVFINESIEKVRSNIKMLVSDAGMLALAAAEGKLDTRADISKHQGDFRSIIEGVNKTLDYVIGPLNVAAEYVDRISKGDIPPHISDEYKGDFNEIKLNLNTCIDSINLLIQDSGLLSEAATEGRLFTRAKAEMHNGDFRKIISGVNSTIDTLVGLLDKMPVPCMIVNKELEIQFMNKAGATLNNTTGLELFRSKTKCFDHYKTGDCKTEKCACQKAISTGLETISETDAHPGNYNLEIKYSGIPIKDKNDNIIGAFEIVVDQTEILKNLKEAEKAMNNANLAKSEVQNAMNKANKVALYQEEETAKMVKAVEELAAGNFKVQIELAEPDDDTKDVYNTLMKILTGVRKFKDAVMALKEDAITLVEYAEQGLLEKRAGTERHNGEFRSVVVGMNNMMNKLLDPIYEGTRILEIMGTGDLTARVTGKYMGGHAKIKDSINAVGESLSTLISQVMEMTQNVSSIALQMSGTAETLAAGSQEQAAQADDVSSAVEEMSRTITENSSAAYKTVEEAVKNKTIAQDGGKIVEQTVQKMRDIANVVSESAANMEKLGESSTKIGEIISVIDDIADQTNLLALNAAIEAARAGEQGRGFAVVADEVRKLAERTTEATKQIATMIKGIQSETQSAVKVMNIGNKEVTNGIELADKAGKSLNDIVLSSQDVQMMINQIAVATEEQSSTSEEIAKNVQSINQVTNESAQRIQDIAESSEKLAKMIESLNMMINQFKVDSGTITGHPELIPLGTKKQKMALQA